MHLGVTEAGEGEDGRMKSAIGIGSLLADGLGEVTWHEVNYTYWILEIISHMSNPIVSKSTKWIIIFQGG